MYFQVPFRFTLHCQHLHSINKALLLEKNYQKKSPAVKTKKKKNVHSRKIHIALQYAIS